MTNREAQIFPVDYGKSHDLTGGTCGKSWNRPFFGSSTHLKSDEKRVYFWGKDM